MKIEDKIIFLIPAKNEEKNIQNVLLKFKKYGKPVVVNDHSVDKTLKISKKFSYKVLNLKNIKGYDAAIKYGLKYIINNISGKYIISIDADGEHSPVYLSKLIKKLKNNNLVIGNRYKCNRWSEYICSFISYLFFSIKDPLCGMKCYDLNYLKKNKKEVFKKLNFNVDNFAIKFCRL